MPVFPGLESNASAACGTRCAPTGRMAVRSGLMAIRTIVVTTRAAVGAHRRAGDEDAARASVARGLALLDALPGGPGPRDLDVEAALTAGRREIESMISSGLRPVGPGTSEAEPSPHPPRTGRRSHEAPSEAH